MYCTLYIADPPFKKEEEENSVCDLLIIFNNILDWSINISEALLTSRVSLGQNYFPITQLSVKKTTHLTFKANKARQFKSSSNTYHMVWTEIGLKIFALPADIILKPLF